MRRSPTQPITQLAEREHERPLTQTIRVASAGDVPPCYYRIQARSRPIFAKAQVLSSKRGRPIFVEAPASAAAPCSYWVHRDIMPELAAWLKIRVFPAHEIVPTA